MASSSPLSSISDSLPVNEDAPPEFVNLDDRYKCSVCRNILRRPVQTKCGHRLCEGCVDDLFRKGEHVTCPNADEFCEKLYRSDIYPDVSARREIRSLPVYCPHKNLGCEKAVPWKDLAKHTAVCTFGPAIRIWEDSIAVAAAAAGAAALVRDEVNRERQVLETEKELFFRGEREAVAMDTKQRLSDLTVRAARERQLKEDLLQQVIVNCKSPRSEQIRSLLSDLRWRVCCDPGAYERFLTSLEESVHQHCAKEVYSNMVKLLIEKGRSPIVMETLDPNPASGPTFGALPQDLSSQSSNANVEMRDDNSYSGLQESLQSSGSDMNQAAQQSPYLKVYKMESSPRGSVLIINNLKFQHMKQRDGSEKDEENLKELFEHLDFTVDCEKNLTASEMKKKLQEFAQSDQLRKVDSCIIVILSHGGQCGMFGVDGTYKDGGSNFITDTDLKIIFSNENCEHLLEKPKLFLIQACRGNDKDKGVPSLSSSNSSSSIVNQDGDHVTQDVHKDPTSLPEKVVSQAEAATFLPTFSDMVIAHCSSDGHLSYRLPEEGSVFIKEVIKVFREHAHDTHVMDMLTMVNDEVATKFGTTHGNKMMPQPTTLLRKKWFLNPMEARV